jgi:hypothetical protein
MARLLISVAKAKARCSATETRCSASGRHCATDGWTTKPLRPVLYGQAVSADAGEESDKEGLQTPGANPPNVSKRRGSTLYGTEAAMSAKS